MKDGRHIIWSNDIDYDDWREDLEEQYPDLTEACLLYTSPSPRD